MITLKQAEKLYGRTSTQQKRDGKGFFKLDLTIPDGQIVGLLGENGAGKSTLLRAMAGLTPLTGGSILYDDGPVSNQYAQLAYITGEGSYPAYMTPLEYQKFLLEFYPNFDTARYRALLRFFELDAKQLIGKMSVGQQVKLEVAAGMGKRAKYLLMDEPFLGKDVFTRKDFLKLLTGSLRGDETIIITSHHIEELEMLLDRAVILHKGHLAADVMLDDVREKGGTLMEVLAKATGYDPERYRNIFEEEL